MTVLGLVSGMASSEIAGWAIVTALLIAGVERGLARWESRRGRKQ